MERVGFIRIFWGLLFVVLDIRINSIDLILPDFIGYILIANGLSLLAPQDRWFRRARLFAIIMAFVSIPSLIEIDSKSAPMLKRQTISVLTGDLSALLPQQVDSAKLLRITSSRRTIDAKRTRNPEQDEDGVLGEYSDGTVALILRYASSEEALVAMNEKAKTEYSFQAILKRAETDESFGGRYTSGGGSSHGISEHSYVEVGDRVIQQWWNRGWRMWDPSSWHNKGGWSSRILYIVEGYQASAATYKSAFQGESQSRGGIMLGPLFPVSILGEIVNTLLIWGICSGIIALSLSSNNDDLMRIAKRRLTLYIVLTVTGWVFPITSFIAPELVSSLFNTAASVLVVHALVGFISVLLMMGLMRRAANSLQVASNS